MNKINIKKSAWVLGLMAVLLFLWGPGGHAAIQGEHGTTFNLEARQEVASAPSTISRLRK